MYTCMNIMNTGGIVVSTLDCRTLHSTANINLQIVVRLC